MKISIEAHLDWMRYQTQEQTNSRMAILTRFLNTSGPVTEQHILDDMLSLRIGCTVLWRVMVNDRQLVHGRFTPRSEIKLKVRQTGSLLQKALLRMNTSMRGTLEQIHRRTLTLLRREVKPVAFSTYADFLAHWQHLYPDERLSGPGALTTVLQQLRALPVLGRIWERDVLAFAIDAF